MILTFSLRYHILFCHNLFDKKRIWDLWVKIERTGTGRVGKCIQEILSSVFKHFVWITIFWIWLHLRHVGSKFWHRWTRYELTQWNGQGNNVKIVGNDLSVSQRPLRAPCPVFKQIIDFLHQPIDIDNWMACEDFGKSIGEIACQTFARPLLELKLKMETVMRAVMFGKS